MSQNIKLVQISPEHNAILAKIIRCSLEEFEMNIDGTVYTDPTTDNLFELFQRKGSIYWVAIDNTEEVIGGCGIYPTKNLPDGYTELVKLYIRKEFRGKGVGRQLLKKSIKCAMDMHYTHLYLESFPSLSSAVELYYSMGFRKLTKPLGESGHFACNLWMLKKL